MSSDRYAPKMGRLTVQERDPIVSREITWETGPNFGDNASIRVTREGKSVRITQHTNALLSMPLDRARLVAGALRDVIEWGTEQGGDEDDDRTE